MSNHAAEGSTQLHRAALKGHSDTVGFLLDNGMSPHAVNSVGETALHLAANAECAMLLIGAGTAIDARDSKGRTALDRAMEDGRSDCAEMLLEAGVRPTISTQSGLGASGDTNGRTAGNAAVSYIDRRAEPFFGEIGGYVDFLFQNTRKMVEGLQQSLANPWDNDRFDRAVDELVRNGWINHSLTIVEDESAAFERAKQCDSQISGNHIRLGTPLCIAARMGGQGGRIQRLLAEGADPNLADEDGYTPLLNAIYKNETASVMALLDAGADPLLCNREIGSALHVAALYDAPDALHALLSTLPNDSISAMMDVLDSEGRRPYEVSSGRQTEEAADVRGMLLKANASIERDILETDAKTPEPAAPRRRI